MNNTQPPDITHLLQEHDLHTALETQNTIGWDNFLRARLASTWQSCQPTSLTISSDKWMTNVASWTAWLFHECWSTRNTLLFGTTTESRNNIQTIRLEAQIRDTYEACNQLNPTHRRHHQYTSLEHLLTSNPTILTLWLSQATHSILEHRKSINNGIQQQLITRYFAPQ